MASSRDFSRRILPAVALIFALAAFVIAVTQSASPIGDDVMHLSVWGLLIASGGLMLVSYLRAPSRPTRRR